MRTDPTITVGHPNVRHYSKPVDVEMIDMLVVTCSECGPVTDFEDAGAETKERLQHLAKAHADEVHEGLVEAEGWAR